ncbi:hypothetical protein RJT34_28026 [Clitoria ternatea]|uniref:Uncharacterized protein n=1 Tax=Clitoria ternatea TaxID=43366 RepID=A0AAN9F8F4_CLITE
MKLRRLALSQCTIELRFHFLKPYKERNSLIPLKTKPKHAPLFLFHSHSIPFIPPTLLRSLSFIIFRLFLGRTKPEKKIPTKPPKNHKKKTRNQSA